MEPMILAVRTVLSKYATFTGRASRPEFWWWVLAVFIVQFFTQLIDALLLAPMLGIDPTSESAAQPLSAIASLAVLLPGIAVAVRRLHDTGRAGWWILLIFIPIVGFLILLWFYTRPSTDTNQWGPPNPLVQQPGSEVTK